MTNEWGALYDKSTCCFYTIRARLNIHFAYTELSICVDRVCVFHSATIIVMITRYAVAFHFGTM